MVADLLGSVEVSGSAGCPRNFRRRSKGEALQLCVQKLVSLVVRPEVPRDELFVAGADLRVVGGRRKVNRTGSGGTTLGPQSRT
jgi:hypothetical protein